MVGNIFFAARHGNESHRRGSGGARTVASFAPRDTRRGRRGCRRTGTFGDRGAAPRSSARRRPRPFEASAPPAPGSRRRLEPTRTAGVRDRGTIDVPPAANPALPVRLRRGVRCVPRIHAPAGAHRIAGACRTLSDRTGRRCGDAPRFEASTLGRIDSPNNDGAVRRRPRGPP